MKALHDPTGALVSGLAAIRDQFGVPSGFPPAVLAAAEQAAMRAPTAHVDRTALPFVTLDPVSSTDLDQAFAIEAAGSDWLLHYAIADVDWFVRDGDALDTEAWHRGTTLYLPDGKAGLYPPALAERAASLLPDGPRPSVLFTIRIAPDGSVMLDGAERALIRSRAKLGYETVTTADLPPGLTEIADRIMAAEADRGAGRVDPPEQEVARTESGGYTLSFRNRNPAEDQNACLSLAANIAIAKAMHAHGTGLFRVMPPPDDSAIAGLRQSAAALGLDWPATQSLADYVRTLDGADPHSAAFMLATRRTGTKASYAPYQDGVMPYHAALAAPYAHATAPLRRLADRYVNRAVLALAKGEAVPQAVTDAFQRLPDVMDRADAISARVERAVIDLAEAVMLDGQEGSRFAAVITDTDERGARIQLCDLPVISRVATPGLMPGDRIEALLVEAAPEKRSVRFAQG